METALALLRSALAFCFVTCCLVSAALQVLAWTRHGREGVPMSVRALWRPESHFDAIGVRQVLLARRLLAVGGWAWLTYGLMMVVGNAV